ncbi:MAG: outer membrane protein assembly factor BamA [Treponema sp.]|nr:outer membrane protein assembly factor BamA [Treponema sp.]
MRRRLLSIIIFSFFTLFALNAEEESDWFWNKPITKIDFEGLKNVKKTELSGITSSFIDLPFTDESYNDLLDRLYSLDLFEDIVTDAKHDTSSKRADAVNLVFTVVEHPVISKINFVGNSKIRNGELRELIKIKTTDIFVESKVLLDERLIRDHYLEKGYADSKVSHKVEKNQDGSGIVITFNIQEGSSTVISAINFNGNTIVSDRILKSKLKLKEVGFMKDGAFQNSTLEADKRTIIDYYKERGYVDVAIVDVKIDKTMNEEKQRQELAITFVLQEGYQYTFKGLTITGNEVFTEEELLPLMKLKEGAIFNATKFEEGLSEITGKYYANGYMSNEFYRIPNKDNERKEISYNLTINEHMRSHVEDILIKGNTKTKENVIRREIPIETGDVFSRDKVMNSMRNLYNTQYFSSIVPDIQSGSEENLIDLIYTVEEQSTTTLQFGMTFSGTNNPDEIPISLYLKLENSNLFGTGKSVSISTNISNTEQSVDLSYAQGWLGNLPISFSQSLSYAHTNSTAPFNMFLPDLSLNQYYYYMKYQGHTGSLGTAFAYRWTPDFAILTLTTGLNNSVTYYKYDENIYVPYDLGLSYFANRWGLTNAVWTSFSIDNRDISYEPSKGWFASERLSWIGLIPGWEKEFFLKSDTKLEGYYTLFDKPITEKWNLKGVFAAYSGLTLILPGWYNKERSVISESSRLYVDGMFNGRCWTEAYKDIKGLSMWSNHLELRIPIVPNIVGIDLFHDAIAVKQTIPGMFGVKKYMAVGENPLSLNDFYFSFGPGIRFILPQFPLHMLFGFRYRIVDGKFYWGQPDYLNGEKGVKNKKTDYKDMFSFTLSFNLVNR